MEAIYLYNVFGHFRPKNIVQRNNDNFLMYVLTCDINYHIDPWIKFLEDPEKIRMYGNLAALQKFSPEIVAILWRFDYLMDKEDYCAYFIQIPMLINIIKAWKKLISQNPRGILMIFGENNEDVEFIPDWEGNKYDIVARELEKREPECG